LELSSPVPPPVPPPPPPLRLLGYRDCGCRQCRRDRQLLAPAASEDRLHRFDMVLTDFIHILVCRYGACGVQVCGGGYFNSSKLIISPYATRRCNALSEELGWYSGK
jgi:hypothetical protein